MRAPGRRPAGAAPPAWLLVLASIASVQVGSAVARTMYDRIGATGALALRLGFAALVMLVVARPDPRRWSPSVRARVAGLGVCLVVMNLAFYLSLRDVPLGVAVTVEFTGPLLLALVQTRRLADLGWALLALAGVALLGLRHTDGTHARGLVLAFVAGLAWAGYILAAARVGRRVPGLEGLTGAMVVAAVIAVPLGAHALPAAAGDASILARGLVIALLSSVVCYGLELVALRTMPTRVFGVLMSLEPAAATLAGLAILAQSPGPVQVVAMVLVSIASAGVTLGARRGDPVPRD